jgi:hypothetical protein
MTWRDLIRNVTLFPPFTLRIEKFTSRMIDVTGRNFFSSLVHSRYIKFMEHYAIVMWNSPVLAGVEIPCLLPSLYYIQTFNLLPLNVPLLKFFLTSRPTDRTIFGAYEQIVSPSIGHTVRK